MRNGAARYVLVYSSPDRGEQRFELANDRSYRIGSRSDNDVVLEQDDVSRHHAILRVRDSSFHITDLNSKNGTYINGRRTAAASFECGDLVNLSSARLVVLESGSGAHAVSSFVGGRRGRPEKGAQEDTQGYSGAASAEDMVSLLVTTASAVRRGAVGEPLTWAVERFGFEAAVVLYRDTQDNVAMVSSAGDMGPLVRSSGTLARVVREQKGYRAGTRIQQIVELGESLLVSPMQRDHVLVVRFTGQPPAIGDIRALIAAVEAVLCSGNPPASLMAASGERRDPEERRFGSPLQRIAGLSDGITDCKRRAADLARREAPILLTGEAGTGKALFARVIHDLSPRHEGPFVSLDCGAVDGGTLGGALFGGGDGSGGQGAFAAATGGTLYLARLSDVPTEVQERILGALGGSQGARGDVRLIVSLVEDVEAAVTRGALLRELLAHVRPQLMELPPLRARSEDIPLLIAVFQREHGGSKRGEAAGFTVNALEALTSYGWPGNVRELRQEVLRVLAAVGEGELVEARQLAPHIGEALTAEAVPPPDLEVLATRSLADARDDFERWRIRRAIHDCGGNQSQAAQRLGLSRAGLFKKMRRLRINKPNGG